MSTAHATLRPARLPDDATGIMAVARAHDTFWLDGRGSPPEQLLRDAEQVHRDGTGTTLVAVDDKDGDAVVAGLVWIEAVREENDSAWIDVYVDPARAGSLEHALVTHALDVLADWPAPAGRRRTRIESGTVHGDEHLAQALRGHGFTQCRTFWQMHVDLTAAQAHAGDPPPGVVVHRVADDPAGRALLHRLCETAFRDHWNHHERTYERFWARKESYLGFDPTQWWVAELDGEPVGALIGDTGRAHDGVGHVQTLGVLREGRGRGVARHLLRVAFAEHLARGWTATELGVDAANPTGATALYRSVGMRPVLEFDAYARELPLA